MTSDQEKLEAKAKASLDKSVYTLDKQTRDDLASIRKKVLQYQNTKTGFSLNAWIPAGAFACCALLTVLILYSHNPADDTTQQISVQQATNNEQTEQIAMLELLTHPEDLETATDPAFYVWMDEVLEEEGAEDAV
ncbi:MAG: hypothetical protein Q8N02_04210 [Methylotenera sp.]|nr:hypothetical protein [Methylotenera sp.]MDO9233613.1 hypothetical protein [Methylotenera sp.]MDP2101063.1 hypothetical protein [Methylotenera sp.]MDP2281852.1 hypothetical protein [Methylotenera sp.]MDP2403726.1 hypothetical protein [Methylotenera sp.]